MPPDRRFTWFGASCHLVYGPASYESPRPLDSYYFGARPGLRTQSLPILPPPDPNRNDGDIETADPGVGEFASERGRVSSSREQTSYRTAFCVRGRLTGDNDEEDMERNTRDFFSFGLLELLSGPQTLSYSGPGGVTRYYTEAANSARKNRTYKQTSGGYQSTDADCSIRYESVIAGGLLPYGHGLCTLCF